ncbi:hypothetical protein CF394_06750 [Tetzosporium hominis]|uniref:Diguanylate cyclase n=1 Tax=Tetzosporium hominis TaxID=2020506 RepID=A0A264W4H8_9BACL|nr:diguanylate cyclase [Tetzosporium hominis]OZS78451.1 hypothetical protein CF394_06750 [Tetzosporium hominis]
MEFLTYEYNWSLVLLSILVAIFAAMVALDLGRLLSITTSVGRRRLILTGAILLGVGIWSMHFIGMLALQLPLEVSYNVPLVLISVFPAFVAGGITLYLISLPDAPIWRIPVGALIFSAGIFAMHLLGMEAMEMPAFLEYSWWMLTIAAVVGYGTSYIGLSLLANSERISKNRLTKIGSAVIMGIGVVLIHYIGMAAAMFVSDPTHSHTTGAVVNSTYLGYGVSLAAFYLLSIMYKSVSMDRKLLVQSIESELKFQALIESAHDAIIVCTTDGKIVQWNNGAERLFGYSKKEILGDSIFKVVPKKTHASYQVNVAEFLQSEDTSNFQRMKETTGIAQDKSEIPIEVSIGSWTIADEHFISFIARDITDRKQQEAQMKDLIYLDDLTGLPNRRLFSQRLQSMLVRAKEREIQFAILYLDLDNFKSVNDTYGHFIGDKLLIEVSMRIYKKLGFYDTLSRIGGDEFLFLLTDTDDIQTSQFAEWLISCFDDPFVIEGVKHSVSPSIGISMYSGDGDDAETLVRNVDAALYWVKENGKNGYHFYSHSEQLDNSAFAGRSVLQE